MIIHHPDRLHERIANGRADKLEAAASQFLAHRVGFCRSGGDLLEALPCVLLRPIADEAPNEAIERTEFFAYL